MKIAYVFTEIPRIAGTFPNAELEEMAARGAEIEIFILRPRGARNEETDRLERRFRVHRSPYVLSVALLRDFFAVLARRPLEVASIFLRAGIDAASAPRVLVKSLAILPKAVHFGWVVRGGGFDLIHAYWASLPALAAETMSRVSGVPYTMWAHAGADIYRRNHQTGRALRSRLRGARLVLTCNSVNVEHFRKVAGEGILRKVVLQTHGVDRSRFSIDGGKVDRRGPLEILAVGKLVPAKGFDVLAAACKILNEQGVMFRCRIVGQGDPTKVLGGIDPASFAGGRMEFPGELEHEELPRLYRSSDVFVVPSVIDRAGGRDGLPNVLLEAMASGVACVGSSTASIPEAIIDGETGLLVPAGDASALAEAIGRLEREPALRAGLGAAAAELVARKYDRGVAMDQLFETLRESLEGRIDGIPAPKADRG